MTVFYFELFESRFSGMKTKKINGYPFDYYDIIIKDDIILPKGALIYVKDRFANDWMLARYEYCTEEIHATLVNDITCGGDWRYCLIPAKVITDESEMPSAKSIEVNMKTSWYGRKMQGKNNGK